MFQPPQRDAIVDALDREAAADSNFGARLAASKARKGAASFEGLFVKNLENVQGDERDHMIISTTYGPDRTGRFYQRFGALSQAGGGRRLNVLVTRARMAVHLVTSIPPATYRSIPPIVEGKKPGGAWLLFSYLRYAEHLAQLYVEERDRRVKEAAAISAGQCQVTDVAVPSELAIGLGEHLARNRGISSIVHWGNDGFGIDAALVHPLRADDVTIGVLCDGTRFEKAPDRVQWDVFRTEMLEAQGWKLVRLWSPSVFRNPKGAAETIITEMREWLLREQQEQQTKSIQPTESEKAPDPGAIH